MTEEELYSDNRLVEVTGDVGRDLGGSRPGVHALVSRDDEVVMVGGHGPESDLLTVADVRADELVWNPQGEARLVMPDGRDLPRGARFTCRGPDLHVLVRGSWYRTDLDALLAGP